MAATTGINKAAKSGKSPRAIAANGGKCIAAFCRFFRHVSHQIFS
jgi:hypothetical protein